MQALVFDKKVFYTEDYPMPVCEKDESLVRILMAAICNTDKELINGYRPNFNGVMGHEFVGIVQQSSSPQLLGKRVVGQLNQGCKTCLYCTTGRPQHCNARKVLGIDGKDGCFASHMAISTSLLHLVPETLPTNKAIFCEPLAAALEIAEQCHLRSSAGVAVVGDGRLAYMIAQVAALQGAAVTVFGKSQQKLNMFAPFATTMLAPQGSFETVIEASGSPSGLASAIALVRSRGLVVLKSTYAKPASLNISEIVVREITLRGSRCGPFAPALQLLAAGRVSLPEIDLYPLARYEDAFSSRAFKAGFSFL